MAKRVPIKFAIAGCRHGHIFDVGAQLKTRADAELVAICEEDDATRATLSEHFGSLPIFDSLDRMLDAIDCGVVAIGDLYAKRGATAAHALARGKHIVSDKPLCISLSELDEIERLAKASNLSVTCQFDMRGLGTFRRLRRVIQEGDIGEVHAISFNGQHPLMYGQRAGWYFEPGMHGGTINDIAIHAFDFIPWLTGLQFARIDATRNWNARLKKVPHFLDAAQVMLTLENGCGVLGDVSYLTPDSFGYSLPHYWRTTAWGSGGVAETGVNIAGVQLFRNGATQPALLDADPTLGGVYISDLLNEIAGHPSADGLTTASVLRASRVSLLAQDAAAESRTNVPVN